MVWCMRPPDTDVCSYQQRVISLSPRSVLQRCHN